MAQNAAKHIKKLNPLTAKPYNQNFHPLKVVTSSEWKLFGFGKMEVNAFEILLPDVTFYL